LTGCFRPLIHDDLSPVPTSSEVAGKWAGGTVSGIDFNYLILGSGGDGVLGQLYDGGNLSICKINWRLYRREIIISGPKITTAQIGLPLVGDFRGDYLVLKDPSSGQKYLLTRDEKLESSLRKLREATQRAGSD